MKGVFSTELKEIEQLFVTSKFQEALKRLDNLLKRNELLEEEIIQAKILKTRIFLDIQPFSEALENAKQAYDESVKLGNKFLIFDSARHYARTLNILGFLNSALEKVHQAKKVFEDSEIQETKEYLKQKAIVLQFRLGEDVETYLERLKQSLSILDQIGDDYEKACLLFTISSTYWKTAKYAQAGKYYDEGLKLFTKIGNIVGQAACTTNIAAIYLQKGELNTALGYSLKALSIAEEIDAPYMLGAIYADLGFFYWQKGDLAASLQYYNKSIEQIKRGKHLGHIHYPAVNFRLILVYLELGKIEEAKQILEKIEIVATLRSLQDESEERYSFMSIYKLAQSIILKTDSLEENQGEIELMLKDVVQEKFFYIEMNSLALFHLCDFYLKRLKETNDLTLFESLRATLDQLDKLAETQKSSILLAETYMLKSHLSLIELKIEEAKIMLEKAQNFADVSHENEDPNIFLIMDKTGHVVFSDNFKVIALENDLVEGIITTIHDFLEEKKPDKNTSHRLQFRNFGIALYQSEDMLLSYVFVGKSYSAVQKIKKLITDFSTFSEIWGDLSTKINSNQELSLSDRTRLSDYLESIFV